MTLPIIGRSGEESALQLRSHLGPQRFRRNTFTNQTLHSNISRKTWKHFALKLIDVLVVHSYRTSPSMFWKIVLLQFRKSQEKTSLENGCGSLFLVELLIFHKYFPKVLTNPLNKSC